MISGPGKPRKILSASFIGLFEQVEQFQNLKFTITRCSNMHSNVVSSFEGKVVTCVAFIRTLIPAVTMFFCKQSGQTQDFN